MRASKLIILTVLAASAVVMKGRAGTPPSVVTLHGIGDVPGGGAVSVVRDATKVGGTIVAVGGSAVLPLCPQPSGPCTSLNASDTSIVWTWDGTAAQLTVLPQLATGAAFSQASAITPDGAFIASQARSNGPSAARVVRNSLASILGNTNPQLLTSNTQPGTYRLFDDLPATPDSLSARPQTAVAISDDGNILYGAVRALTMTARFDMTTNTSTVVPVIAGKARALPAGRGASADGNVLVGTAAPIAAAGTTQNYGFQYASFGTTTEQQAFRYVHSAGVSTPIPGPAGNTWSKALAVSADGARTLVAGNSTEFSQGEIYVHDAATGTIAKYGSPNRAWRATSFGGMSDDGTVLAVTLSPSGHFGADDRYSYIRNSHGWFHLTAILHEAGVDPAAAGWTRFSVNGMSRDATLVFGHGIRTNGNTEGFVIEFPAGYLASFNPQPIAPADTSIVGAWTDNPATPGAVVTFMKDGTYYTIGSGGFERGLYRFDGTTVRVITLQDQNGTDGISDANLAPMPISLAGDELRAPAGCSADPCDVITRITSAPGSIVGGWVIGTPAVADSSAVVVLMANGTFFWAEDRPADIYGQDGVEIGTWFWNISTGRYGANLPLVLDTNGEWGLSHTTGQETIGLSADELQLVATDGSGVHALRIVDPQTVRPSITSVLSASGTATTPFAYAITATRAVSYSLAGAPAWMSVNGATGEISGTPGTAGTFGVTISAANSFGDTDSQTLTVTIAPPNTSTGANITVQPVVPEGGGSVTLAFSSVDAAGETTVAVLDAEDAPPPPGGFQVGGLYYDLETTADFSGPVTVCFSYTRADFGPGTPRLFHYDNGAWVDITSSLDQANKIICGVTQSFSPFAVLLSPITRTGFHAPVSQTHGYVNVVKGGATVPLKFNVYVDGVEKTDTAGLAFGAWAVPCGNIAAEDPVDFTTNGQTGLRYDASAGAFIQNWKTPSTPGCYVVRMTTIGDGLSISALFRVR